jgi:hypothetical protein
VWHWRLSLLPVIVRDVADEDRTKRIRLTGARFEGGRLPVDSLVELQKYQDIIRIAAEAEWRRDNPGEPVPADLVDSVSLTIERIDEGSADVFLAFEQQQAYVEYQAEARDAADAVIVAAYSDVPIPDLPALSPEQDRQFRDVVSQLGSSLVATQSIEFYTAPDEPPVAITVETRTTAVERLAKVEDFLVPPDLAPPTTGLQTTDTTLVARITTLYADESKFDFVLPDGTTSHGWYRETPGLLEDLREAVNPAETGPLTRISGSLQYKQGQVFRFWEVSALEKVEFDDTAWGLRLTEFASLLPGWFDGEGKQISSIALDGAQMVLRVVGRAGLERPGVFPTEEGGVLVEWASESSVRSVEVLDDGSFEMFSLARGDREGVHSSGNLTDAVSFLGVERA